MIQAMDFRQFGTKPLPEPVLIYCRLDPYEHIWVEFESKYNNFYSPKYTEKCRLQTVNVLK